MGNPADFVTIGVKACQFLVIVPLFITMIFISNSIDGSKYWNRVDFEALPDFTGKINLQQGGSSGADLNDPLNIEWAFWPTCRVLYHPWEKDGVSVNYGKYGFDKPDIVNFQAGVELGSVQVRSQDGVPVVTAIGGTTITEAQRNASRNLYKAIATVASYGKPLAAHFQDAFQKQWDKMLAESGYQGKFKFSSASQIGAVSRWPNADGNSLWVVDLVVHVTSQFLDNPKDKGGNKVFPEGLRFAYMISETGHLLTFGENDNVCGHLNEDGATDPANHWKYNAWMHGTSNGISASWLIWMAIGWFMVRMMCVLTPVIGKDNLLIQGAAMVLPQVVNWYIAPFSFIEPHEEVSSMVSTFYSFSFCVFWTVIISLSLCAIPCEICAASREDAPPAGVIALCPWIVATIGALVFFCFYVATYGEWTLIVGLKISFRMSWPSISLAATVNAFRALVFLLLTLDILDKFAFGFAMLKGGAEQGLDKVIP